MVDGPSKLKALAEGLVETQAWCDRTFRKGDRNSSAFRAHDNLAILHQEYEAALTPERVIALCRIVMAVDRPEVRYELDDVKAAFLDLEAAFTEDKSDG